MPKIFPGRNGIDSPRSWWCTTCSLPGKAHRPGSGLLVTGIRPAWGRRLQTAKALEAKVIGTSARRRSSTSSRR